MKHCHERRGEGWRWGVPDWRDASAYPSPDDTPMDVWRWQFLRRRSDYREYWLLHFDRAYRCAIAEHARTPCPDGVVPWEEQFSRAIGESEIEDRYDMGCRLLDPSVDHLPIGWFAFRNGVLGYANKPKFEEYRREMIFFYKFDIRMPLPDQFRRAEAHLRHLQKELGIVPENRRRQVRKWPMYLRLLDARDAGATYEEIGGTLIDLDPGDTRNKFDRLAGLEPKAWAKAQHDQALEVAFNFPA